jgi:hypothetical protein
MLDRSSRRNGKPSSYGLSTISISIKTHLRSCLDDGADGPPSQVVIGETDTLVNLLIAVNFVYFEISLGNSLRASRSRYSLLSRLLLTVALFGTLIGPVLAMRLAVPLGAGSAVYLQMVFQATMSPAINEHGPRRNLWIR